jgi:hypothetical protein
VIDIYRIKGLLALHFEMYYPVHALDYCGNFADFVALRILVSRRRGLIHIILVIVVVVIVIRLVTGRGI